MNIGENVQYIFPECISNSSVMQFPKRWVKLVIFLAKNIHSTHLFPLCTMKIIVLCDCNEWLADKHYAWFRKNEPIKNYQKQEILPNYYFLKKINFRKIEKIFDIKKSNFCTLSIIAFTTNMFLVFPPTINEINYDASERISHTDL